MGRAETVTILPIDRWATLMRIPAPHFNQLQGAKAPLAKGCDKVWDQDAREDLAWTMKTAEEMIAEELGFQPAPAFLTDTQVPMGLAGVRSDWRNAELRTEWGHVQAYGVETLTLRQADAGVQYTNEDNDPLERKELATIGTAIYEDLPACSQPCDVAIFFREQDIPPGLGDPADPRWEIRPIKVDIDGNTMRIRAESSLFVWPRLWELTEAESEAGGSSNPDPLRWQWDFNEANLVDQVDVYCRTVNNQLPVTLFWDGVCDCASSICNHSSQTACAFNTDDKRGFFAPRPASGSNVEAVPLHRFPPESVTVNYRAGFPINARTCWMNPQLERAIVKLTNVLLPEPPCGFCDEAQRRWVDDRETVDPLTIEAANLPWDLNSKGALDAWKIIRRLAMGRGRKLGRGYR